MSALGADARRVVDEFVAAAAALSEAERAEVAYLLWAPVEGGERS